MSAVGVDAMQRLASAWKNGPVETTDESLLSEAFIWVLKNCPYPDAPGMSMSPGEKWCDPMLISDLAIQTLKKGPKWAASSFLIAQRHPDVYVREYLMVRVCKEAVRCGNESLARSVLRQLTLGRRWIANRGL